MTKAYKICASRSIAARHEALQLTTTGTHATGLAGADLIKVAGPAGTPAPRGTRTRSYSHQRSKYQRNQLPTIPNYKGCDREDEEARGAQLATKVRGWRKVKTIIRFAHRGWDSARVIPAGGVGERDELFASHFSYAPPQRDRSDSNLALTQLLVVCNR
jgi:hypothetical protein